MDGAVPLSGPVSNANCKFLLLPQEIRDIIYDYAVEMFSAEIPIPDTVPVPSDDVFVSRYTARSINPRLREVCKQLKDEVEGHMGKNTKFFFQEAPEELFAWQRTPRIPQVYFNFCTKIEIILDVECAKIDQGLACFAECTAANEIGLHTNRTEHLISLFSEIDTCELELSIQCYEEDTMPFPLTTHCTELDDAYKNLVKQIDVKKMLLYKRYATYVPMLWATWVEGQGWIAAEVGESDDESESENEEEMEVDEEDAESKAEEEGGDN